MIDETGKHVGVLPLKEAIDAAHAKGLDLVEISAKTVPPIAKMTELGKHLYELEKKERKARKHQKRDDMKGIRLRLSTSSHDLLLKAGQVDKFLKKGYKVQAELQLRGREKSLEGLARQKIKEFLQEITEPYKLESEPKRDVQGLRLVISRQ